MEKKIGKLSQTQWNLAGAALATLHYHVIKSSLGVGVSSSSCTVTTISARHNGQYCNWEAHFLQNPLWENYFYIFNNKSPIDSPKTLTCVYTVPSEWYPSSQSTTCTSPRVRSTFAVDPEICVAATRSYPAPSAGHDHWNCQISDFAADTEMVPNRNWNDTVEMT